LTTIHENQTTKLKILQNEHELKTKSWMDTEHAFADALEAGRLMDEKNVALAKELAGLNVETNRMIMLNSSLEKNVANLAAEAIDRESNIKCLENNITMMIKQNKEELESALEGIYR
jgi:hypothetical protein